MLIYISDRVTYGGPNCTQVEKYKEPVTLDIEPMEQLSIALQYEEDIMERRNL